jgi:pimeloyl-ACP methyl ester carboxylesterase
MKKAYIDLKRGQMHYRFAGNGDPVVMLHMSGNSSGEYEGSGNILAQKYSVYAVDLFGFGYSDKPEKYLSIQEHMDTIVEFMDALGISSAYLVGSLVGANICARLAAQYPDRVKGLLLAHICYNPDPNFYPSLRHADCFTQKPPMDDGSHLQQIWDKVKVYGESAAINDVRATYMHLAGPFLESMHWALCDDADFGDCLPTIKTPTVVVAFDIRPNGPMPEDAAKIIPNAKFEVMEGCSPLVTIAAPEKFAALFNKYFNK